MKNIQLMNWLDKHAEIFFLIYYGISMQFFLIPIGVNQLSMGAGFRQIISDNVTISLAYIGIILFCIPLVFAFYLVVKGYLQSRLKK